MTKDNDFQQWKQIIESYDLSAQHFLDYTIYFHTEDSDEYILVKHYITDENLLEFIEKFFSHDSDQLLEDLLSFIECELLLP